MNKFEYLVEVVDVVPRDLEDAMNKYGEAAWEIYQVVSGDHHKSSFKRRYVFYMKRKRN